MNRGLILFTTGWIIVEIIRIPLGMGFGPTFPVGIGLVLACVFIYFQKDKK